MATDNGSSVRLPFEDTENGPVSTPSNQDSGTNRWRRRFAATLAAAVDAIIIIDQRGVIESTNPATEKMFGYSQKEMVGQNVSLLMPEPYRSEHDRYLGSYLESGEAKIIGLGREVEGQRSCGETFPIELAVGEGFDGERQFFVGLIKDISERKRLEEELRRREEELRWAHENALIANATFELDGTFRSTNEACCELLGYSAQELLELNIVDVSHPDDREAIRSALQRFAAGELDRLRVPHRCIRRDGEVRYSNMHMSPIHDESSRPMWLVAQLIDQTERLQAEREAHEHRERLAHMNRLGTLGEMAAAIAHEVNQPLGAISNYAQAGRVLLAKPEAEPQKLAEILEKVSAQALRAGEVIRRLRTLAGRGQGGRDVLNLNETVREVVKLAELDAHLREVTIETDLHEPMPEIVADEVQVQQVVLNLLRNGIEAMEAVPEPRPSLVVRTGVSAADVEITVADRGEGIAPEVADKIMSPFFSSKQSGMGLGLAICRSIIDSHGGRLWFTANRDAGTVFHVTLPIDS